MSRSGTNARSSAAVDRGGDLLFPGGQAPGDGRGSDGDQGAQDQGCRLSRLQHVQAGAHGGRRDRDAQLGGCQWQGCPPKVNGQFFWKTDEAKWLSGESGQ